jgi:hypothetical protein
MGRPADLARTRCHRCRVAGASATCVIPLKPAEVRIDGSSWWVAADVCRILGHGNSQVPIKGLDDDAKGVLASHTSLAESQRA